MNGKVWIIEIFLASLAILIILFTLVTFTFSGSHIIDGYNITFTDGCKTQKATEQQNYTSCSGWANTDSFDKGSYREFFIVSKRPLLAQYTTCLHEKRHFEITNMTFDDEEEYIQKITNVKLIPDYDETCFNAMIKAIYS